MRHTMLTLIVGLFLSTSVFSDSTSAFKDAKRIEDLSIRYVRGATSHSEARRNGTLDEEDRQAVRDYYWHEHQSGTCPPGLVHMQSSCMSLNRDRKWSIGTPLPREAVAYQVSADAVSGLPLLLSDTRYVRVDTAILLVRSASALVLDAVDTATDF